MTSITVHRRSADVPTQRRSSFLFNSDDHDEEDSKTMLSPITIDPQRKLSLDASVHSSTTNPNRLKHFCSRLKRRFSISKEVQPRSEEVHTGLVQRRRSRFSKYTSFSSPVPTEEEKSPDFDWPDFEKIYDSIPSCLINTLPGLDDFSNDDDETDDSSDDEPEEFFIDEEEHAYMETMNAFIECKRGHGFRRNALCQKLDKTQHSGQLDTFIQQLMIEKLMRTWT